MDYVLITKNLRKKYGRFEALKGLTMHIPKGAIYGLVGKNGAGKTTLIRLVCGLQRPSGGGFEIFGVANDTKGIGVVRRRMGAVVETPSIHPDLTATENLKKQCEVLGIGSSDVSDLLELVGLSDTGGKKAGKFSLGMRQRLGIAMALCGKPDFLILDEPTNGLDPQGIVDMRNLILQLNLERGITILISSHILDELSKIATQYGFVSDGVLVKEMEAAELEYACKKSIQITTDGKGNLATALKAMDFDYKLISQCQANIYADVEITPLVLALHEQGISILRLTEKEENLEQYYFSLLGGDNCG